MRQMYSPYEEKVMDIKKDGDAYTIHAADQTVTVSTEVAISVTQFFVARQGYHAYAIWGGIGSRHGGVDVTRYTNDAAPAEPVDMPMLLEQVKAGVLAAEHRIVIRETLPEIAARLDAAHDDGLPRRNRAELWGLASYWGNEPAVRDNRQFDASDVM